MSQVSHIRPLVSLSALVVVAAAIVTTILVPVAPAHAQSRAAPIATYPGPGAQAVRIRFRPGHTSATITSHLPVNGIDTYTLRALAGQTMTVNVSSNQAHMLLQVSGADGNPLKTFGAGMPSWSGPLPATQDYLIAVATEDGGAADYTLEVVIPPLGRPARAHVTRIWFRLGSTHAGVEGYLRRNGMDVYVLRALYGQTMSLTVASQEAHMLYSVNGADGQVLKSAGAGSAKWSGQLPGTQDYFIRVTTEDGSPAHYSLEVTIPPHS